MSCVNYLLVFLNQMRYGKRGNELYNYLLVFLNQMKYEKRGNELCKLLTRVPEPDEVLEER